MDEDDADSVFQLITRLCEKFHDEPEKIKKSRSFCYEILLGKRIPKHQITFKDLKGTTDPFCNLLSWQLTLIHDYNLRDHANDLQECSNCLQECYGVNIDDGRNILQFLLKLRNIPSKDDKKLDLSSLPPIHEFENFNNLFKLPSSLLHFLKKRSCAHDNPLALNSDRRLSEIFGDEGYYSPTQTPEDNIWEVASKLKYSNRRNWENFGYPEPDKERPFLSELGDMSSLWVENLESLYMVKLFRDGTVFNSKMKSRRVFIRDLKYLLVGMASDSFGFDERGEFYMVPSVTVEGITPDSLENYCKDLMFCGTCYKALNRMSVPNPDTGKYKYEGHIFSANQLSVLRQNTTHYYLEVCTECGPRFNLGQILTKSREQDPVFMSLIAKKRAATLRRLELERQKVLQEQNEKKAEEITMLRDQYEAALQQKQSRIAMEIEKEMREMEENLNIEIKRQKLIQDEANKMVDYYMQLFEIAEERKAKIENHIKKIKSFHIDQYNVDREEEYLSVENLVEKSNSSSDSFYSLIEEPEKLENENVEETKQVKNENVEEAKQVHSSESMDYINANKSDESKDRNSNKDVEIVSEPKIVSPNIQRAMDNFETARKIKHKVMLEELGIEYCPKPEKNIDTKVTSVAYLTDAQKNKIKILSSEFGIELKTENFRTERLTNASIANRNKVMGISDCFVYPPLDNENFINKNLLNKEDNIQVHRTGTIKKSKSLLLDFDKLSVKSHKSESEKPIPMSVDSTPLSDLPQSQATTPSTTFLSIDTNHLESIPNTADTHQTDEGFNFNQQPKSEEIIPIYLNRKESNFERTVFSKRVTLQEAAGVSTNCLKLFLYECVQIPLIAQTKLVNNELLRHFISNLNYFQHLTSLRDYFFLQDGEFGRNIMENLFSKLYDANFPVELINCRTLQDLVFGALDMSSKHQDNSHCLSFKINSLPKCFDLGDPDVLDCLSLTYKELKLLAKETGKKEIYLMASPQYRKLHQCRHIMTQFIQTLQNYIVGEVLQSSWELFEKNLTNVTNLEDVYSVHMTYIKNILFMCLLNQKTVVLRNIIQKIFLVILKFYDFLRSRSWNCEDGSYVHPNFNKLEIIFKNFQEFVLYLFRSCRKVARSGYQPHLNQLLDMLDINAYYSESLKRMSR
ncbi:hypothetical protein NQ314_002748 [Rhamnusium bicolor]|uniref:Gamma-tubulin complex component 6 n=1 Tax=Rhamnusium bicolor TaxID=1586634 RepID=A0AAV8ZS88_9CUCU|nr:hypothetical protein NQ314_002748 [Rhamnusium bicolor]